MPRYMGPGIYLYMYIQAGRGGGGGGGGGGEPGFLMRFIYWHRLVLIQ